MMPPTRVRFVASAEALTEQDDDALVVVLDPTWTPASGDARHIVSARRALGEVVERIDCFDGALDIVDAWADATGIADRLLLDDTTYWFRMRETMWRWTHERLLWRHALPTLGLGARVTDIEIPTDELALADVARRLWPDLVRVTAPSAEARADTGAVGGAAVESPRPTHAPASTLAARPAGARPAALQRMTRAILGRSVPRPKEGTDERARREKILADRVATLARGTAPRVLVLTNPATHQRVGGTDGDRVDPLFAGIIERLAAAGLQPVLIGTGLDQRRDEDWALIEHDDRLLPQFLTRTRWSHPEDDERAEGALSALAATMETARDALLEIDGLDMGAAFTDALAAAATAVIRTDTHTLARVERLLAEIEPRAIVLAQEGIRTPWLMASRRAGIPAFAVQHGVLYTGHAGYPNRRHPALCLPTCTFVYGDYERDVLLARGAYLPDEVETSGSPRLDLDRVPEDAAAEGLAVRRELGVADHDRLLVVSTVNLRFIQRSHFVHMLEKVLGGPLQGLHLVFKQHPGEHDEGPYRDLLDGIARAGGYEPPPMSVVKDIDLYRLLRAADAHLGLLSTVLTDAVVAGTPDLIGLTDRHADLLGYVDAGVARYVRSPAELLSAIAEAAPPVPAARTAFLAKHFRAGDAGDRIVAAVTSAVGAAGPVA